MLLDREPAADVPIPMTDPDVRVSWGDYLDHAMFDLWAQEHLTNFNKWVKYVHTKIILLAPLTVGADRHHRVGQLLGQLHHRQRGEHGGHPGRRHPSG